MIGSDHVKNILFGICLACKFLYGEDLDIIVGTLMYRELLVADFVSVHFDWFMIIY